MTSANAMWHVHQLRDSSMPNRTVTPMVGPARPRARTRVAAIGRWAMIPVWLVFASLVIFRTRSFAEATQNEIDILNVHKVAAVLLVLLVVIQQLVARGVPRRWPATLWLYFGYLLVGVISTVHSSQVAYSLWKLAELFAALFVGVYVLRHAARDQSFAATAYEQWLMFLRLLVALALVGAVLLPGEALQSPVSELTAATYGTPLLPVQLYGVLILVNSNSLGAMAAILLYVEFARIVDGGRALRPLRIAWVLILGGVLVLAQSRTAWGAFVFALLLGLFLSRRLGRVGKLATVVVLFGGVALYLNQIMAYLTRGASREHLSVLTGRAAWWEAALDVFGSADLGHRLFGLGFVSANRTLLSDRFESSAATLHSDYVDALVSTGIIGTAFLTFAVAALIWSAARAARERTWRGVELAGVVAILVVRSFTGTTFAIHNQFIPGVFLVAVLCSTVGGRRDARPAPGARNTSRALAGRDPGNVLARSRAVYPRVPR